MISLLLSSSKTFNESCIDLNLAYMVMRPLQTFDSNEKPVFTQNP
uniref:Uncharacterized protein n=1 Tax=Rhizophora mucronata TaxID=61149 RepID=A0A2P2Q880_RHIMU